MGTWKERIIAVFTGRKKSGEWFTHSKIIELVDKGTNKKPESLSMYLAQLTMTGHIERAIRPPETRKSTYYRPQVEYLYRWTGKPYVQPDNFNKIGKTHKFVDADEMRLGAQIYNAYPKLPKWYRQMMK